MRPADALSHDNCSACVLASAPGVGAHDQSGEAPQRTGTTNALLLLLLLLCQAKSKKCPHLVRSRFGSSYYLVSTPLRPPKGYYGVML